MTSDERVGRVATWGKFFAALAVTAVPQVPQVPQSQAADFEGLMDKAWGYAAPRPSDGQGRGT